MASFSIKVDGYKQVEKSFDVFGSKSVEAVQQLVNEAAVHLTGSAKRIVPVKTGRLMGSIQVKNVTLTKTGATSTVGPNTDYESYVEYGTSRMSARPYMRPAALETEGWIETRAKGVLS